METSKQSRQKNDLTPFVMSVMVLLVFIAAFIISRMLYGWYNSNAILLLSPIVLGVLLPFLVKYSYRSCSEKTDSRLNSILTVVALLLLSVPVAFIVTTFVSRGQVLEGKFSLEEIRTSSPCSALLTLRWSSILISLFVFSVIAILFWNIKSLHNTVKKSKAWLSYSVALLFISLIYSNIIYWNNGWYYSSEQALLNDSKKYYNNAIASYKLCCQYNDSITRKYDEYLSFELTHNAFSSSFFFDILRNDTKISKATLKEKDAEFKEYMQILLDNIISGDGSFNDRYSEYNYANMDFYDTVANLINANKIKSDSVEMRHVHSRLEKMNFNSMGSSMDLRQRTEELKAIVDLINDFTGAFRHYHDDGSEYMSEETSIVTWKANEKRQIIDERLKAFNAKYHFDEQSK